MKQTVTPSDITQPNRRSEGGRIDRSRPLKFYFNEKPYTGFQGDTLASALLANGIHMVGRSFKYHRPRGILGAGSEDPAGLVQLWRNKTYTEPNTRATEIRLSAELEAFSQNVWPSLKRDVGAINDVLHPFFSAGFYYKTFMGPPAKWMQFEPIIRKAAGLGVCPNAPDPERYEHVNRHCDVLVIGAGPAGLMAARAAAAQGARVMLVEETSEVGGRLLARDPGELTLDGHSAHAWAEDGANALAGLDDVDVLTDTCAFGYYYDNTIGLVQQLQDHLPIDQRDPDRPRQRLWLVRAREVVLATGAIERPLVFHNNDRPGIMLAGAAQTYLHRYGVLVGQTPAIFTNNSSAYAAAFDMADAGANVAAIIDARRTVEPHLLEEAKRRSIEVIDGATVTNTAGRMRVERVWAHELGNDGSLGKGPIPVECDVLLVSGGWTPNIALFSQSRGKLAYDDTLAGFAPALSFQKERSAGACNGAFAVEECLEQGLNAGRHAAQAALGAVGEKTISIPGQPQISQGPVHATPYAIRPTWNLPSVESPANTRAFVDIQNDVTAKDLKLAVQEGYRSVEHAKRYTTVGMGTDQGKVSGLNAFGILSQALGKPIPDVGVTTFRQPYKPVTFGAVAGQQAGMLFHPRRTTPMHDWHEAADATFEVVGDWLRARTYRKRGESFHDAVQRESRAARTAIGMLDASTLGKIDVRGPDARTFLNRVYSNAWLKLPVGACRYGLMLNEDGMVFDDGVTACLADDHFHMTTTTGGAANVLAWLEEYHQTEWPDLKVHLTSVTEQWAVASICGPKCPELMAEIVDDIDTAPDNFPFMTHKSGHIQGIPARVFRISFTGEMSYEINVPASYGAWLWELLIARGEKFGITPYGTEAMHLLRAEKGFIIVGQDTDGTVTPHDLQMGWAVKKSADFIGARSLTRSDTTRSDRPQLVGLVPVDEPRTVIEEGAQLVNTRDDAHPLHTKPVPMAGYVTSSYFSPTLNRSIAMALVNGGAGRLGEIIWVARAQGEPIKVQITQTDFLSHLEPLAALSDADKTDAAEHASHNHEAHVLENGANHD